MPNLDLIVKAINETLNNNLFKDKRFSVPQLFGISETIVSQDRDKEGNEVENQFPAIVDLNGDSHTISPDGDIPIMVFHKIEGSAIKNLKKQYGRKNSSIERLTVMKMIVVAFRDKIKVTRETLDLAIMAAFPTGMSSESLSNMALKSCSINVLSSIHNDRGIYQREWPSAGKPLDTSLMIFEINYQIGCTFDKNCINPICC